jgi:hypothetical protein
MKTYKTLFLAFAVLALALSAFMPAAGVSAASLAAADGDLATVTRVSLVKVENRTATIRVSGTYLCDKLNIVTKIDGSVINIEAQEAGGKKCSGTPKSFIRDVKVKALMPGSTYTVVVNGLQRLTGVSISSSAPGGPDAVEQKPSEISNKLASIRKITLVSTGPYTATFHLTGKYTCDKVRFSTDVIGKTIYINVHDVKNRGNDCDKGGGTYSNWLTFSRLVPGIYTVHVNSDEYGKPDRKLKDVIIPIATAQ